MTRLLLLLLLLFSLLASPVLADPVCGDAIEFNEAAPLDDTVTISYTTPAGSNQVLFVGTGERETAPAAITVTHAGNSLTSTATGIVSTSPANAQLFYIINPTSGTNDVVVNYGAVAHLANATVIWTCSGVNTAAPVHDATEATNTGTAVTVTVPNLVAGDVVVDFFFADVQTVDPTEGANQTVFHKGNDGAESGWGASFQAAADGGVMSWTLNASQQWAQQSVAISPALATGGMKARNPVNF